MAGQVQTKTMTAAEYMQLPVSNEPTELINGVVVVSPSPKDRHQALLGELYMVIRQLGSAGTVRMAPMDVHFDDDHVLQPDIFWVSPEGRCKLQEGYWYGPPDLVVEIFSSGTARLDKINKYKVYERHGVREYWMVDPDEEYIEVLRLEEGKFRLYGVFGPEDSFQSPVMKDQIVKVGTLLGR